MFLGENCMFLGEKCIFFGENAWISENQEGFALEKSVKYPQYILQNRILKNSINSIRMNMNLLSFLMKIFSCNGSVSLINVPVIEPTGF